MLNLQDMLLDIANKIKDIAYKLGLIADYVAEQGIIGNWKYEKWASGKYVAWTTGYKSATGIASGSGSIGYDFYFDITLPSGFVNVEIVSGHISCNPDTDPRWGTFAGWQMVAGKLRLYQAGEYNTTKMGYALKIIGTWK